MTTSTYRFKRSEDFAEFKIRERGPGDHPAHVVELECSYNPTFCGSRERQGDLMREMPRGSVYFDRDGGKVWRVLDAEKDQAIALALKFYKYVYEVASDGITITEHHSGKTTVEPKLF